MIKLNDARKSVKDRTVRGSILYCGDTALEGAAGYLAGLMTSWGWGFDYVPSHLEMTPGLLDVSRSLIILSDYPAAQFSRGCQEMALREIEQGCGLLMIGGWESFHGFGGNWDDSLLGSILPVEIQSTDDRRNFAQSAWLLPCFEHAITTGLPWSSCPPAIGGMNQVAAKSDARVILKAHPIAISVLASTEAGPDVSPSWLYSPAGSLPALVVGQHQKGRTAAFLSDVAPHWVGGFVDWGMPRVAAQAPGAGAIEVGGDYAQFWKQLLEWVADSSLK